MFIHWRRHKKAEDEPRPVPQSEAEDDGDSVSASLSSYEIMAHLMTDRGCVREVNEDSGRWVRPGDPETLSTKGLLFVVADGMGGHTAGELASSLAVDEICRSYYSSSDDPLSSLKRAFSDANEKIYDMARERAELQGMGTTCTALALASGSAFAAHVGDSRMYLLRDGEIYLMTVDHSAVMELVKEGLLTLEEARHHPDKNVIVRALGVHDAVEVTSWDHPFPVRAGDQFLLCSDGLYDLIEDREIRDELLASDAQSACENLIRLAKERGGHDNITVSVVSIMPIQEVRAPVRGTREVEVAS